MSDTARNSNCSHNNNSAFEKPNDLHMNYIAASSPTASLPMDANTCVPVDLSLEDFEDEDLSDILHDSSDAHLHSYANDNFKVNCRKSLLLQQRQRIKASKKKESKQLHRSYSVSDSKRPRPTTLNFFAEPARPGPLPSNFYSNYERTRKSSQAPTTDTEIDSHSSNNNPSSETRLKPTFSDDTIKNNNTDTVNDCQIQSVNKSKPCESETVSKTKDYPFDSSVKLSKNSNSSLSRTLPRHLRLSQCDVTQSIRSCSGLTRSASEWSIDDPDKVEYCYFNGEFKEQTHSALFKFIPRHQDEIRLEINDPLHIFNQADDFWYEGINMRTGQQGIFPSYYAQSLLDYTDKMSVMSLKDDQSDQFNVYFLGSVEVASHKGNDVLCQAMHKVKQHTNYFRLRNVSFCGHHPKNDKYFAFITRHPQSPSRFACHVFVSDVSTRPLAECIGRAFEAFYHEYMNSSHPAEDIYIE